MPGTRRRSKTPGWVAIAALALVIALPAACGLAWWESEGPSESTTQAPRDAGTVDELLSADDREGFAANYSIRGRARLFERDYEMAVSDFDVAVELEGDNPRYYLNRALAYSFMGKDDLARGDVLRAAQLSNTRPFGFDGSRLRRRADQPGKRVQRLHIQGLQCPSPFLRFQRMRPQLIATP